jgi:hypothetical protein
MKTFAAAAIILSPLLVLFVVTYILVGHRSSWREWLALPLADPGGFGLFTALAVLIATALAVDRWRRLRPLNRP